MMHLKRHLLRADERGASAIEFAFVAGILAVLLIGLVDFGMGFWDKLQVANGARAGAEYAVSNSSSSTDPTFLPNVQTAASNATYAINISNFSVPPPTEVCGCPDATTGITENGTPPCSGTCTYGSPGTYVKVSAQGDYKPIFSWPGLPSPLTFKSSAIVRIN